MDMLILQITSGSYGAAWFIAAKILYGRWRIAAIEKPSWAPHCKYCFLRDENLMPRPEWMTCAMAMIAAILWPIGAIMGLIRYGPPLAPSEIEAQRDALQSRVAELEEELEL